MKKCLLAANSPELLAARKESARKGSPVSISGSVAVLPLYGPINHKMDLMTWITGGTALNEWVKAFRALVADPNVGAIVMDVDSPGGSVSGVDETSEEIYRARGKKPIIAVSNPMMASAAYYLASSADEIVAAPTAETGSVGVILLHEDWSEALEDDGIKITAITYGENKAEGNWWEPLSEDAKAYLQSQVDAYGRMFTNAVARNRGLSPSDVQSGFGQGRMFIAKDAVKAGMVDRVATLDEVLKNLGVKSSKKPNVSSVAETLGIQAEEDSECLTEGQRCRILDMF